MREIKFRGKHFSTGEWVYGNLIVEKDGDIARIYGDDGVGVRVSPHTVGQWLLTRDKTEIYEGDIVRCGGAHFTVEWQGNGFVLADGNHAPAYSGETLERLALIGALTVIGNVHDKKGAAT